MVLMCMRLLPEGKRDIYLQGASSFSLPKAHVPIKVYCSRHNLGAKELAEELRTATEPSSMANRTHHHHTHLYTHMHICDVRHAKTELLDPCIQLYSTCRMTCRSRCRSHLSLK